MKPLLPLLALLAACSTPPADTTPTHAAVSAYVKANAHDPASYEPVRWGGEVVFTRRDSARVDAEAAAADVSRFGPGSGYQKRFNRSIAVTDTTRVGTRLTHAYRVKNKLGALVLDSAQFVVYPNSKVQPL